MTIEESIYNRYLEFIEHWMNKKQAIYCCRMMSELTRYWFERYISSYFHKIEWYKTKVIWWFDQWIDIEWSKKEWNKVIHILIQCKKWFYDYIRIGEILTFWFRCKNKIKDNKEYKLYFATTTYKNKESNELAKKENIQIIDCWKLLKFKKKYSLDDFAKDFWKDKYKFRSYKKRFFSKRNVESIIKNHNHNHNKKVESITKYNVFKYNLNHHRHYWKLIPHK